MAKGNKVLTISYGLSNIYTYFLTQQINSDKANYTFYTYNVKFNHPLVASFDYAISDYTTIGLSGGFYTFHLHEKKVFANDTSVIDTKGFKMAIQLRGIRYIVQSAKSVFYIFVGGGVRFRSLNINTSNDSIINAALIHQIPETNPKKYSPFSLDAGLGLKFLVTKKIGFSCEFGMTTGLAQFGLFYSLKNKWRRVNDKIGW